MLDDNYFVQKPVEVIEMTNEYASSQDRSFLTQQEIIEKQNEESLELWIDGDYRIAFLNNFKFINDLTDYSFEGKREIKELFHFEYNRGIPSFVFSNCDIFGYKVYFKTKLILEFNSGKVYSYILQQLNFLEYNIAIIKIQMAINQLKMFVDTDIEAVRQKMLNGSITSNYLLNALL
ncbi:9285_t:CDS:2 [Dentiscutata heterogama]|uniref:9285_t:CDS:1 n=1 Tax=Dentiscutata heterogama TaxID=1316150 RepID=A0ACA9M3N0_9GLOM|nr:9285_t:CDS:2 [Dentiscutata heterogama]